MPLWGPPEKRIRLKTLGTGTARTGTNTGTLTTGAACDSCEDGEALSSVPSTDRPRRRQAHSQSALRERERDGRVKND